MKDTTKAIVAEGAVALALNVVVYVIVSVLVHALFHALIANFPEIPLAFDDAYVIDLTSYSLTGDILFLMMGDDDDVLI